MLRFAMLRHVLILAAGAMMAAAQTRPEFKPTPEVPAMPKALMKFPRTEITRAKFPAVDFHLHGRSLQTAADYQKMIRLMDQTGLAVICNMDGGFGKAFHQNINLSDPSKNPPIKSPTFTS